MTREEFEDSILDEHAAELAAARAEIKALMAVQSE